MSVMLPALAPRLANIVRLIDAEFNEMPGTRLTAPQVRRLWNASQADCEEALDYLCEIGHLVCDKTGRYGRGEASF